MILDSRLELASNVDVSTTAGTALVGSQIDLEAARDFGAGQPLYLVINVTDAFTSAGSSTNQFILASDASASVSTTTATHHILTPVYAKATLALGFQASFVLPAEGLTYERYLGLLCVTAVATTTAGSIDAYLTFEPSVWTAKTDSDIN